MSNLVRWSALCETSVDAYRDYLRSCRYVETLRADVLSSEQRGWLLGSGADELVGSSGCEDCLHIRGRGLCSAGGGERNGGIEGVVDCDRVCESDSVGDATSIPASRVDVEAGNGGGSFTKLSPRFSESFGKHHRRNVNRREKKKLMQRQWRESCTNVVARPFSYKGVFSECSSETQAKLRETRAVMLVKQNELSVLKAEAEARRVAAQLKSQVIERGIEMQRVKQDSELTKLVRAREAGQPQGFAETVVSEGLTSSLGTPSLSDGSVSPDSSISVAELNKLRDSYAHMVQQVHDLTAKTVRQQEELTRVKAKSTVVGGRGVVDEFFDADEGAVSVGDRRFDAFHFGDRFAF